MAFALHTGHGARGPMFCRGRGRGTVTDDGDVVLPNGEREGGVRVFRRWICNACDGPGRVGHGEVSRVLIGFRDDFDFFFRPGASRKDPVET